MTHLSLESVAPVGVRCLAAECSSLTTPVVAPAQCDSRAPATGRLRVADAQSLRERLSPQTVVRENEPLAPRTTLRVGGCADFYVEPATEWELAEVARFASERGLPWLVLGRGSNLLVRDGGVRGVVVCLCHPHFGRIEADGDRLRCGAGARLKAVALAARRQRLTGFEFLEGIPGTLGGALRMNAGAMGASMFSVVERVLCMDAGGVVQERLASELPTAYRGCPFFRDHVALSAVLFGHPAPEEEIRLRMESFSQKRWASQPPQPSAGCIFKNPPAIAAGRLIEELELKGARVGGAVVSAVHANFIITEGGATARDVEELIRLIQDRARAARGLELLTEVQIVGEP